MASSQQSALDYVRNVRTHLVERLQNLSVIVEKLSECKVLNKNEVSVIDSIPEKFDKTRKILDMVTAKGEAACYELLKILDATRKRTFPKIPPDLTSKQQGPSASQDRQDPNLHQWISCFSFKDDLNEYTAGSSPCYKYQRELKSKAKKIFDSEWNQNKKIVKDKFRWKTFPYTSLVLDTDVNEISKISKSKKYKKSRQKKLKTFIPIDKRGLSPEYLLKTHEKKILLMGKPGIGKTTVAQQVLSLWAEREDRELNYMFYFDERSFSNISKPINLRSLLFDIYLKPTESSDEVLQDIEENSENIVMVFDGIRDVSCNSVIQNIVENVLRDAKIIITCRPEDACEGFLSDWPTFTVEVQGFSAESIRTYFKKMFSTDSDTVCSVLNDLQLFSLCHVPMYAFIVTACISFGPCEAGELPSTVTEMYLHILRHCMRKISGKDVKYLDRYIQDNRKDILHLAAISFNAMLQKTALTGLDCEENSVLHAFLRSAVIKDSPSSAQTVCVFLHNTMLEFWAALWLLQNPDKIGEILKRCRQTRSPGSAEQHCV
ncbi:nucleotide-binding oligomerization domain-containing protein 2-like [Megalops cyprinoides]|uniref:nucleotide-binding oligomerization domain-containing protein 2-like n=1 Tax=Megalops cyprinoides TaxID=118141 RepID=UPI001863D210|nr:nucleotide-binding oligomerization domain-containing protein 2-like [Megalops cyprinoides]